jgi:hypothetical protein
MTEIRLFKEFKDESAEYEVEDIEAEKKTLACSYKDVDALLVPGSVFQTASAWYRVEES